MNIGTFKALGMTGAFATSLLVAAPAFAASWEKTVSFTNPQGDTKTVTTSRTCNARTCTDTVDATGYKGNTVEASRTYKNFRR